MILSLDNPTAGSALVNGRRFSKHRRPIFQVGSLLDPKEFHPGRSAKHHLRGLALANGTDQLEGPAKGIRRAVHICALCHVLKIIDGLLGGTHIRRSRILGLHKQVFSSGTHKVPDLNDNLVARSARTCPVNSLDSGRSRAVFRRSRVADGAVLGGTS